MPTSNQFCTFALGPMHFGVHVRSVQEVIRHHEMTRVPTATAVVRGLINLRGQIVLAIDLHRRLGLESPPAGPDPINVIVRTDDRPLSLLVDEVGDILDFGAEATDPPPETIRPGLRRFLQGIYKLPDRLLLVLDVDQLADFDAAADVA